MYVYENWRLSPEQARARALLTADSRDTYTYVYVSDPKPLKTPSDSIWTLIRLYYRCVAGPSDSSDVYRKWQARLGLRVVDYPFDLFDSSATHDVTAVLIDQHGNELAPGESSESPPPVEESMATPAMDPYKIPNYQPPSAQPRPPPMKPTPPVRTSSTTALALTTTLPVASAHPPLPSAPTAIPKLTQPAKPKQAEPKIEIVHFDDPKEIRKKITQSEYERRLARGGSYFFKPRKIAFGEKVRVELVNLADVHTDFSPSFRAYSWKANEADPDEIAVIDALIRADFVFGFDRPETKRNNWLSKLTRYQTELLTIRAGLERQIADLRRSQSDRKMAEKIESEEKAIENIEDLEMKALFEDWGDDTSTGKCWRSSAEEQQREAEEALTYGGHYGFDFPGVGLFDF